jgi:predicted lipoprotein
MTAGTHTSMATTSETIMASSSKAPTATKPSRNIAVVSAAIQTNFPEKMTADIWTVNPGLSDSFIKT